MRKILFGFALFLSCIIHFPQAYADKIVVGVEDLAYMPYYSVDNGEYNGFARDLFDSYAADRNHQVKYRPLPVERLFRELLDGTIDLKFPDNPVWRSDLKKANKVEYSTEVAPFLDGVLVSAEKQNSDRDKPLRIGTIRGFTPWPLTEMISKGEITSFENNSIPGLLRQVLAHRLDGAFLNVAVAQFHLQNTLRKQGALTLNKEIPFEHSSYFASSVSNPSLVADLNNWLSSNSEKVKALQMKWGINPN